MNIEPEFFIITMLVFALTAAAWLRSYGMPFSIADLTVVQPRTLVSSLVSSSTAKQTTHQSTHKAVATTFLLPASPIPTSTQLQVEPIAHPPAIAGSMPIDTQTQLTRVSAILQDAIDLAAKAERLHTAAHEQLDSAHYALQNLLNELTAVMPVANATKSASRTPAATQPQRPAYVTALAA